MIPEIRLVRCRWVIAIWGISFILAVAAAVVMDILMGSVPGYWESAMLFYVAYGGIVFGLFLACRSHSIRILQMIGPIPSAAKVFGYALVAIPVFLSSLGGAWLISLIAPHLFDGFANEFLKFKPESPLQAVLTFSIFVVVAPAVEEFTFRGLLFTRLSVKYSSRTAIVVSSLMFGLLHVDFIGAFVFGLVAASMYARSRSLVAPFALHSMNNLIAFAGFLGDASSNQPIPSWVGLLGVFAGIPACAFLIARWTRSTMVPPYIPGSVILGNIEEAV